VRRFLGEAALDGRADYLTGTFPNYKVWRAYGIVPSLLGDANSLTCSVS